MNEEGNKSDVAYKDLKRLRVPVSEEEEQEIIRKAKEAGGLSVAAYLRKVGLGYELQSSIDSALIADLAKINADQGRLGGLLKMWLTNDERFLGFDGQKTRATIEAVLAKIEETQATMLNLAKKAD